MVPPKKREPIPENPHANGPNWDVLLADPEVTIHVRPPGPIPPVEPDIQFILPVDGLELLGRRQYDEDE